jgi:hypothetical protein
MEDSWARDLAGNFKKREEEKTRKEEMGHERHQNERAWAPKLWENVKNEVSNGVAQINREYGSELLTVSDTQWKELELLLKSDGRSSLVFNEPIKQIEWRKSISAEVEYFDIRTNPSGDVAIFGKKLPGQIDPGSLARKFIEHILGRNNE